MNARWDDKRKTRRFPGEPAPAPRASPGGRRRKAGWAALGALLVLAAAVSATQAGQEEERIGVCHATGSQEQPYVFLVVKEDGFEHGHHRHHDGDFFVTDLSRGCVSDDLVVPPTPAENGTEPTEPAGNASVPDDGTTPPAEPQEPAVTPEPTEPSTGNETSEPANETAEPTEPAEPAEPANETQPEPAPEPAGDVSVRQSAVQDDFAVTLTLHVLSVGPGVAHDVVLTDQLPDVRRSWQVAGDDAAECVLDGRSLSCWFGDLPAGEERTVELRSYTDRMPCGWALTNTAVVSGADDAEARNDASSASIAARAC